MALKTQDLQDKNQQLNEEIVRREQAQKHLIQTQEELVQSLPKWRLLGKR